MKSHLLNTQWQRLPKDVILRLQAEKLHRYLRDVVVPFSAHYREVFKQRGLRADSIKTVEDLELVDATIDQQRKDGDGQQQHALDEIVRGIGHEDPIGQVSAQSGAAKGRAP